MMKQNISKMTIPLGATVKDALERLNETGRGVVFLVDDQNKVIGSITDGDVRRTLLRGEPITALAEKAARRNFTWSSPETPASEILTLMNTRGIRQVPVLDAQMKLIRVHFLEDFVQGKEKNSTGFPAVIMAGGRGVRLRPFTDTIPKPLLKVGDTALIERIIIDLRNQGVEDFFITVNYLADQIKNHLGNGDKFGCKIQYIHEQDNNPLGTAGSLSLLRQKINTNFLVINGDVLSTLDLQMFSTFHKEHQAIATVCAKIFTVNIPYGVVNVVTNNLVRIDEKPDFSMMINAGIYFFSSDVLQHIKDNEALDMPELLRRLVDMKYKVTCFQSSEPWIDIGSHADFERVQKNIEYLSR